MGSGVALFQSETCIISLLVGLLSYCMDVIHRASGLCRVGHNANGIEEQHHVAQPGTHLFQRMLLFETSGGVEPGTARFIFGNPLACVLAVLDLGEHAPHGASSFRGHDLGSAGVVAMLGGVAYRIAHVVEAATVHEVDDEL